MKIAVLLAVIAVSAIAGDYLVGYGDTLWDLSLHFYGTPLRWEEILAANPQIEGPEYLYPGMIINIPGALNSPGIQGSGAYTLSIPASAVINRSSEPVLSRLQREGAGMVAFDPVTPVGTVIQVNTEEDSRFRFDSGLPGDLLEIDYGSQQGAEPGQILHILREGEEVEDPADGDRGRVYRVAGVCSVTETRPSTSVVQLEHGYLAVREGDLVLPYRISEDVLINNEPSTGNFSVYVLALKNPDNRRAYAFDVVYINEGTEAGIRPGDVFSAYTYGEQYDTGGDEILITADIPVADLVILTTERRSASAMVVSNRSAVLISPGDRLYLVKSQALPER